MSLTNNNTYKYGDVFVLKDRTSAPGNIRQGHMYIWSRNNVLNVTDQNGLSTILNPTKPLIGVTQSNRVLSIHGSNVVQVIGQYGVGWIESTPSIPQVDLHLQGYNANFSNDLTPTTDNTALKLSSDINWIVPKTAGQNSNYNYTSFILSSGYWYQYKKLETFMYPSNMYSQTVCNKTVMNSLTYTDYVQTIEIKEYHKMAMVECIGAGSWSYEGGDGGYAKTFINLSPFRGKYLFGVRGYSRKYTKGRPTNVQYLIGGIPSGTASGIIGYGGDASFVTIGDNSSFDSAYHQFICIGGGGGGSRIDASDPDEYNGGHGNSNHPATTQSELGEGGSGWANNNEFIGYIAVSNGGRHGVGQAGTFSGRAGCNLDISTLSLGSTIKNSYLGGGGGCRGVTLGGTECSGGGGYGGGGLNGVGGGAGGSFGDILDKRTASVETIFTNAGYSNVVGKGGRYDYASDTSFAANHGGVIITLYGDF